MVEPSTSETSVNCYQTTRRNNPKDSYLRPRHLENLKSHPQSIFFPRCERPLFLNYAISNGRFYVFSSLSYTKFRKLFYCIAACWPQLKVKIWNKTRILDCMRTLSPDNFIPIVGIRFVLFWEFDSTIEPCSFELAVYLCLNVHWAITPALFAMQI
jgi:hypothetical protein